MDLAFLSQRGFLLFGVGLICLLLEHRYPLRPRTQNWWNRLVHNVSLGMVSTFLLRLSFYPLVAALVLWNESTGWGLLPWLNLPPLGATLLGLLLLDYTLYIWHVLLHKVPFLWRFHRVHHIDPDMDTTTALRFHFGELVASSFYRSAWILLLGVDPWTLLLFEALVTSSAQFHHSNLRLPFGFEKALGLVWITPRFHGIHHSEIARETDSNYGALLSLWDRLHRTQRPPREGEMIRIGVSPRSDPAESKLFQSLLAPFGKPPHP
jgi:sterol desaturase/sphingolipid hydroxylase (fatty acid hydroxylase superfamily)